jgi:FG-GAP-like repeat
MRAVSSPTAVTVESPLNSGKAIVIGLGALALLGLVVGGAFWFFQRGSRPEPVVDSSDDSSADEATTPAIKAFCADCHGMPDPASFPKIAWHEETRRGFDFYMQSNRTDLDMPPLSKVVNYFRNRAPVELVVPSAQDSPGPSPVVCPVAAAIPTGPTATRPAVAHVHWSSIEAGMPPALLLSDMRSGQILTSRPGRDAVTLESIAKLKNPAHALPVDLDGDGRLDLVVADLGSFLPADHKEGRVMWLRRTAEGSFAPHVIQSDIGRVADVEPGDFDGDGDLDLIVAEFGWHKTGSILLLDNQSTPERTPKFERRVIDPRPGTIHVPPCDLNQDGRLDFVALISQEHETIEAFLNDGKGGFSRETIHAAGDPAYGSSGIQVVDFDQDGDLDVVYTNGDTFDSFYLKPYHGIRWLENRGSFPFEPHHLAAMPGAHRALAGDLDGDGDMDLVASALIPANLFGRQPGTDFDALLWLEQTSPGTFARHSLLRAECNHPSLDLGDFDNDGDLDIALGGFGESVLVPQLTVFWNDGPRPAE